MPFLVTIASGISPVAKASSNTSLACLPVIRSLSSRSSKFARAAGEMVLACIEMAFAFKRRTTSLSNQLLADFARALEKLGVELISTGGTAKLLAL